ncbi:MAG: MATE family efflux transporter, partial [Lachnospiraceae bacterium]|nr:MATE family efflux transporter [Lachnospiraceae bacterium]
ACVMSILSVCKKDGYISLYYILKKKLFFARDQLKSMGKLWASEMGELLLVRVGFLLTAMLAAKLGTNQLAAHQVGMNVMSLSFSFGEGLSVAAVALIGRSLGEQKEEKAKMYGSICQTFGLSISIGLSILYLLGGRWFYSQFFAEPEIVEYGVQIMRVMTLVVLMQVSQCVYTGSLRGAGDMVHVMIVGTFSVSLIRPSVSYLMAYVCELGIMGIWCGVLADQFTRLICNRARYKSGKWMKIKI